MTRQNISSASPYEPIVGFSRAVRIGNIVSVSGTAPIGPDGKNVGVGDAAAQARRCLEIIRMTLEKAGAKLEDVIRTRTFLTRKSDWEAVGRVHGKYSAPSGRPRPWSSSRHSSTPNGWLNSKPTPS